MYLVVRVVRVTVLGSAREVGRSAFLVDDGKSKVLLDYGVMFRNEPLFPIHVKPKDISGIVLTHAHLDHSGCIPYLFLHSKGTPVYATEPTIELSKILLLDMIKVSGFYLPFEYIEVMSMIESSRAVEYREEIDVEGIKVTLHNAGHIIGSSCILVECNGKRIFYTGDINTRGSRILHSADVVNDVDLVITESTYALEDHQPREEAERSLVEFANEVVDRGGILFIPSFSVERAQEVACVLKAYNFKHRVAIDGMALRANEIMLKHKRFLKDPEFFSDTLRWAKWVKGWGDRKRLVNEPCVVISPAGMLVGGNALFYMQSIVDDPRNGIAIVSYQGEGTPGRALLEKGIALIEGEARRVRAEVRRFDFSGHSGRRELFEMVSSFSRDAKVLTVHGDHDACIRFADEIGREFGLNAYAPLAGEYVEL